MQSGDVMENTVLVLILAGGQSRRMGQDKAMLPFGEGTMLTTLVERFSADFDTAVSLRTEGQFALEGVPVITDQYPGQGPLAGLQAAFAASKAERIFLTGTDLPFLTTELMRELLTLSAEKGEADAWVLQRADGKTEPLCGVYHRRCAKPLEDCLQEGRRSFKGLFQRIRVCYIPEETLQVQDVAHQLDNLNTPEDYQRAVTNVIK